jgi:hypothetical protein
MKTENKIWYSEYELRQFIDMAVRYKIDGVYKSRTDQNPFSVFKHYVENARENFDNFCHQLNEKLTENPNWKAIEIDLKDRFLLMINRYIEWYQINKNETDKFEPYNPYSMMLSIIESTQKEIVKYFPESLPPQQTETKAEQETPTFKNNFDKISQTEIYNHFKVGLVEKEYLTEQELNEYLKLAFELKTIPETLFKIKDAPNKTTIEAVFYKYYKNVAGKSHGKQKQYAALLGDYFEGYKTTTVSSNFSKSVY